MPIFVYADESGVFDKAHNETFVFGGVIFRDTNSRDNHRRKYRDAERTLGARAKATINGELKGSTLDPKDKASLFRSLNQVERFAVVIKQENVLDSIFEDKKSKQRYLDYAFKIGLKRAFQGLIKDGHLSKQETGQLCVFMDEHTTATNGRYELREALDAEFRVGTHNYAWNRFHPPVLPNLSGVDFTMRDSEQDPLIRAADIVANKVYFHAQTGRLDEVRRTVRVTQLP